MRRRIAVAILCLLAGVAMTAPTMAVAPAPAPERTATTRLKCETHFTRAQFRAKAARIMRSPARLTAKRGRKLHRMIACAKRQRSSRLMRAHLAKLRTWRRSEVGRWKLAFKRLSAYWQGWAERTSHCEARKWWPNKAAMAKVQTGNGFLGAFQFTPGTARVAGFRKPVVLTTWWEQAVRSVRLAMWDGTHHWPRCG